MGTELHNIEAEQAVIGTLFLNNDVLPRLALTPDDFFDGLHAAIFAKAIEYIEAGKPADALTLKAVFASLQPDNNPLPAKYLLTLTDAALTVFDAPSYARLLRELSAKRALDAGLMDVIHNVNNQGKDQSVDALITSVEELLHNVSTSAAVRTNAPVSFAVSLTRSIVDVQSAYTAEEAVGFSWGLKSVDKVLGKFAPGEVTVLGGRPSMGKTAVAGSVALSNALEGHGVLIESLEMRGQQIALRCTSDALKRNGHAMPYSLALNGFNGSDEGFRKWIEQARDIEDAPLLINDTAGKTLPMVRSSIISAKHRLESDGQKLCMVVVDYLQLLESGRKNSGRVDELSQITRSMKEMAKEFDVAMVLLSQLSRRLEDRDDKRPMLSDLRESGSIEQDADRVVMVYRHEHYLSKDEPKNSSDKKYSEKLADWEADMSAARNRLELIGTKLRMGRLSTAEVGSLLSCNHFYDLESPCAEFEL